MTAKEVYEKGLKNPSKENFNKLLELDKTGQWIFYAGQYWGEFDFAKGFERLLEIDKDGEFIFWSAKRWEEFDFKRGFDKLLEVDKTGGWIYDAGREWKEFDYKKALDRLLEVDRSGYWIFLAGIDWKVFDYEKSLNAIKGTEFYDKAINTWWKKSPKAAKLINKIKMDKAEQFPQKKFKLKEFINEEEETVEKVYNRGKRSPSVENFNKLLEVDKTGQWIYYAGLNWGKFDYEKALDRLIEVDKIGQWIYLASKDWKKWKEFDFKKAIKALYKVEKPEFYKKAISNRLSKSLLDIYIKGKENPSKENFNKLLELDDTGYYIYGAGLKWEEFDYIKGLKALEGTKYYKIALDEWWRKSPEIAKIKNELVKKDATQMPQKKFKLKESTNESKKAAKKIYIKGLKDPSEENFNKLLELDTDGTWLYQASLDWEVFDYEKALDRLIEVDEDGNGRYIYLAGSNWDHFDYKRGLDKLIKAEKIGEWIFYAGRYWKEFDYEKAIKALKGTKFYEIALNKWWKKSPEVAKIKNKTEMDKAIQFPQKKFKLKESAEKETAKGIYNKGKRDPSKENFDKLLKLDKKGIWILWAGKDWKEFDHEAALDRLIKISKDGLKVYEASSIWPKFNYAKALKGLEGTDYYQDALAEWKNKIQEEISQNKLNLKEWVNEEFITESGIKIPKNTHAVKIVHHADFDGVMSAIITREQLKKQGIEEKHITTMMVQYGGSGRSLLNKFNVSRGQMVTLVDFAGVQEKTKVALKDKAGKNIVYREGVTKETEGGWKVELEDGKAKVSKGDKSVIIKRYGKEANFIPGEKIEIDASLRAPDFWSDHHVLPFGADVLHKKAGSGKIGVTEFGSDTEHIARVNAQGLMDDETIKAVTSIDSAKYGNLEDTLELPKNFKEAGRMVRLANITNSLISQVIKNNPTAVKELIKRAKPSLVSVYDTTLKIAKLNDKQVEALTELAKKNPNWSKIDEIRKELPLPMAKEVTKGKLTRKFSSEQDVDDPESKKMKKIMTVEQLRKKGYEDIINSLTGYFSPKMADEIDTLKDLKKTKTTEFNQSVEKLKEELKRLGRKKNDEPSHITDIRNRLKVSIEKATELMKKETKEIDDKVKELEAEKKKRVGRFTKVGSQVIRQDATALKGYPGRFVSSLLTKPDGKFRYPFTVKRFSTMIQIAANPDIPEKVKKEFEVDLNRDMREILTRVRKNLGSRKEGWAFDIIDRESGGHASITNVSGLGTLGLMPKPARVELQELEELERRFKALKNRDISMKDKMPKKYERLLALRKQKGEFAWKRKEIMNEIEREFYKILNTKYAGIKVDKPIRSQERYVMKESLKEWIRNE